MTTHSKKKTFNKSVSLLTWAYNEEETMETFLKKATELLDSTVEDYEIILIEDGSSDRTYQIAKEFQEKNPKLKIFQNECNLNVGISSQRAIQKASKEFLFWQTVDWSYDISNIHIFFEYLKSYDVVQGVRRKPTQAGIGLLKYFAVVFDLIANKHLFERSDSISKAFVSLINYFIIRVLFRIPLSDFQNVTFYSTKWIQSVSKEAKSSFANPELLIKSYWSGKSIKEVPIRFIPRKRGEAKGTKIASILKAFSDIIRLWFKWIVFGQREKIQKGRIDRLT